MKGTRLGIAMCGSYCTYGAVMPVIKLLSEKYDIIPIMSEKAASTDSRFGKAEDFKRQLEEYSGKTVIDSIVKAEPIGPKKLLDVLLIMPCTGNTISKIASGMADTVVSLAAKSHLRNGRPVVIAISTNDGLGGNAKNIGELMARKNIYIIPFRQDDPIEKPNSLVSDFSMAEQTIEEALKGKQIEPILI